MIEEQYKNVKTVTRTRFAAARRLQLHDKIAQWTVAMLSVLLILTSLVQALNATNTAISPAALNVIQVSLAVFVLVFSLLIAKDELALKADRMHRCGLQLNQLLRRMEPYREAPNSHPKYDEFAEGYHQILSESDNHKTLDYIAYKLSKPTEHYKSDWTLLLARVGYFIRHLAWLAPYLFVWAIMAAMMVYLFSYHIFVANVSNK